MVNLRGNPFLCDCHLKDMFKWLLSATSTPLYKAFVVVIFFCLTMHPSVGGMSSSSSHR